MANLEILMEYFAGNRSDRRFKQCEEQLKILMEEMKPAQELKVRYNVMRKRQDFTYHPANVKLCKLLADIFNMRKVNLYWGNGIINAYTYPPIVFHKVKNNANVGNPNPEYVKMTAHIVLYEDLVTQVGLNEKELLAVILHEMGHNFTVIPFSFLSMLLRTTIQIPFIELIKFMSMIEHKVDNFLYKYIAPVYNFFDILNDIGNTMMKIGGLGNVIEVLCMILSGARLRIPTDPLTIMDNIGGYQDEKASDSFCAVYGYGSYQISALDKMHKHEYTTVRQLADKTGLTEPYHMINDINALIMEPIMALIMEEHPNINVRYHNIRRKMEEDLKANLPKEYKKELQDQLDEMDKVYKRLDTYTENDKITLRKSIYKMLDDMTDGHPDWREILDPIQDAFNF